MKVCPNDACLSDVCPTSFFPMKVCPNDTRLRDVRPKNVCLRGYARLAIILVKQMSEKHHIHQTTVMVE
jgi:hypothetical protein